MSYTDIIKTSFVFFPVIAFLFTLPYLLYNYRKFGSVLSLKVLIVYSFILYLLTCYFLVILPLPSLEEVLANTSPKVQLMPFRFLRDILKGSRFVISDFRTYKTLFNRAFIVTAFNVVLTIPFGMYLRYYFNCSLKKTLIASFFLSLFFEITQLTGLYGIYPKPYRLFDVDDLFTNTLGGVIGYLLITPIVKLLPSKKQLDEQSYILSRKVSCIRKACGILTDALVILVVFVILIVIDDNVKPILCFQIYLAYTTVSYLLTGGKTLGYALVNVKVARNDNSRTRWYQYILRTAFFVLLFYLLPTLQAQGILKLAFADITLTDNAYLAINALYVLFIGMEIIRFILNKPLMHEILSKTEVVSTLSVPDHTK
ncbi:MAG: VanZ family protein [Erysipelotrichaceae bacterium]|nr:VanZ family protein [Erysipelotrichaceae bacterium]